MPVSSAGRWTFQTLRAQQARRHGYAPMAPEPTDGQLGDVVTNPTTAAGSASGPFYAFWGVVLLVLAGGGVGIAAGVGAFDPASNATATDEAGSGSAASAPTPQASAAVAYPHTRVAGTKVLWPEGSNGDGNDHLPEATLPGLLFYQHTSGTGVVTGLGLSGHVAYNDGPDEAAVYARCAALSDDAAKAWATSDGGAATGTCDAFVAWELTQYSGALGPDGANAYCFFLDAANAPYTVHPLQSAVHTLGLRSRIYSKSALA